MPCVCEGGCCMPRVCEGECHMPCVRERECFIACVHEGRCSRPCVCKRSDALYVYMNVSASTRDAPIVGLLLLVPWLL